MHLSPIKGGFPHKDQHDRTAKVKSGNAIERGNVICIDDDTGEWRLAQKADVGVRPLFLALQRYNDLQAVMAGLFTPANGNPAGEPFKYPNLKPGARAFGDGTQTYAAISGIHMDDGDVWETDEFVAGAFEGVKLNAPLTVNNGELTPAGDQEASLGFLVKVPTYRYVNDAVAVEGMMTGKSVEVVQFQCGL